MPIIEKINDFLENRRKNKTLRKIRDFIPISASHCEFRGKNYLNFSSNDYLGLSKHPRLIQEAVKWTEKIGSSSSSSRLVCGTFREYSRLEQRIADWKQTEKALILGSGYLANCGAIAALAGRRTAIFADKLNHASLNAASILSEADFKRFSHLDYEHLEWFLRNSQNDEKLIVSDTIFSMDGDIANVEKLCGLAAKYKAFLYLDDAHATGVFGKRGEGTPLDFIKDKSQIAIMGTFSKGMGAYGAYLAGNKQFINYMINACQSFIYSTALPPSVYGTISAAVELVQEKEIRASAEKLLKESLSFASKLRKKGFNCGNTSSQIIPVITGNSLDALELSKKLLENGILAVAIRPPAVPDKTARIRISLNTAHSKHDINFLYKKLCANNNL